MSGHLSRFVLGFNLLHAPPRTTNAFFSFNSWSFSCTVAMCGVPVNVTPPHRAAQSSTSTPFVDLGCRKTIWSPSAPPGRGRGSISCIPLSCNSIKLPGRSATENAMWMIPSPLFSMISRWDSRDLSGSRSSIFV